MKIGKIPEYLKKYIKLMNYKHENSRYNGSILVYDTSLKSDNLGDEIINFYCNKIFDELGIRVKYRIPTHVKPTREEEKEISAEIPKLITGTNILSSKLEAPYLWSKPSKEYMFDNIVLMGNGWEMYTQSVTPYTKIFYKKMLSTNFYHSVRDEYSKQKLNNMGITRVLNTACPTTWNLSVDFCKAIPKKKGKNVITTITDYSRDESNDWFMLETLLNLYDNVYIWIQGERDLEYIRNFSRMNELKIVGRTLKAYNDLLKNEDLDYVGTRLHAGIHALNNQRRSIIVSIDNRAREMGRDISLPIIERSDLKNGLVDLINTEWSTEIKLPMKSIELWKQQFIVS